MSQQLLRRRLRLGLAPFPELPFRDRFGMHLIGSVRQPQRAHVGPSACEKRILGAGVSEDTFLASAWANVRTLRLADGPDEVHTESIAKWELGKWSKPKAQSTAQ